MKNTSILIVDDDKITREILSISLSDDYTTFTARDGQDALEILSNNEMDIVLSDLIMPGLNGIDLLERINLLDNKPVVIFLTGNATVETAVQAMKMGAYDYVTKPINVEKLVLLIEKSLENKRLKEENIFLKNEIKKKYTQFKLEGNSPEIKKIMESILRVSMTTATVLVEGESGTGKELVANVIHYNSLVANGPLIKVNCSAFSEGVLESELFGHERGAFTGAINTKKGWFELADKGTLFLDEVGDMPSSVQAKLLRFLQEKTFERVGGTKTFKVDVRIVSATNKMLKDLIKEGKFREDLYYRLRVVRIEMPPLRERRGDIEQLAQIFIDRFSKIHNLPVKGISDEVMRLIKSYNWPGNVRELMNCIESSVVMTKGDIITVEGVPDYLIYKAGDEETDMGEGVLHDIEKKTIIDVLNKTGGDKTMAARMLGIGLRTLYRKIEKWNIN